ncbi:MAG TPA: hypothetical protein VI603_03725 [Saprospiraceae bacterium]|nr:hypothetical protein [Saprospiraceae bacterium]
MGYKKDKQTGKTGLKSAITLEHRKQQVVPLPHFLFRIVRYTLFAGVLIVISVCIGTIGYHHFGQISWLDSFHMACMILTGMGPVSEMKSDAAKLFSSFYALYSGVAFLSITAVFFAPMVHRVLHILHVEQDENDTDK